MCMCSNYFYKLMIDAVHWSGRSLRAYTECGRIPQLGGFRRGCGARGLPSRADPLTVQAAESAGVAPDDLGWVLAPVRASVSPAAQWRGRTPISASGVPPSRDPGSERLCVAKCIQVVALPPWAVTIHSNQEVNVGSMFVIIMWITKVLEECKVVGKLSLLSTWTLESENPGLGPRS